MGKLKQAKRLARQQELLKNFEGDFYQEKQVGDEWYIKQWNGGTQRWQVAIYSKQSYANYKSYQDERDYEKSRLANVLADNGWKPPTLEDIKKLAYKI